MAFQPGSRLGPYEIVGAIGAGGMGEVYRARDSRLDRDVAIKVLPESLAGDPERLMRFEREVRIPANERRGEVSARLYAMKDDEFLAVTPSLDTPRSAAQSSSSVQPASRKPLK